MICIDSMVRRLHIGLAVIVAVVIAVVVGLFITVGSGAISVSGPTTLTISNTPAVVRVSGVQYIVLLHGSAPASNVAYVYIGRSPVYINPILNVTLILYNSTNVNAGMHSYADMQIKLNSLTNSSASITITPLQSYLNEQPSSGRIHVISQQVVPSSNTTTSVARQTTAATTTVQATTPEERIVNYLKNNEWYGLMQNYTTAYANTANCTQTIYNNDYAKQYSRLPSGPATYANVTAQAPYRMSFSVTSVGSGNYNATWSTLSNSSLSSGPVLILKVNLTTGNILNTTIEGIFKDLSYTSLQGSMTQAQAFGNACGILVA